MSRERLILTGFMGMGKSTVGRRSAEILQVPYVDTDEWMEANAGVDIADLVRTDMNEFRALEAKSLGEILSEDPGIVSTGGGIVSTKIGRDALITSGLPVVWLQADFEVAEERIRQDTGRQRPLFADIAKARDLYAERMDWYAQTADYTVDAYLPLDQVVNQVVFIARSIQGNRPGRISITNC